jgi:hypothetical protein
VQGDKSGYRAVQVPLPEESYLQKVVLTHSFAAWPVQASPAWPVGMIDCSHVLIAALPLSGQRPGE